jgi:uncharacterized coiled-coil DUF342 family protein
MENCDYFESPKKEMLESVLLQNTGSESESESESESLHLSGSSVPVTVVLRSKVRSAPEAGKEDARVSQLVKAISSLHDYYHSFQKDFATIARTAFPVLGSLDDHQKTMRTDMNQMKDDMNQMKDRVYSMRDGMNQMKVQMNDMNDTLQSVLRSISASAGELE